MKRVLLILATLLAAGFLLGSLGLWLFLSRWVPVQGKARLIEELERAAPIRVSIGAMRYELIRGLILDRVEIVHRPWSPPGDIPSEGPAAKAEARVEGSEDTWFIAPQIQLHVGWGRLLAQRIVAFRAKAPLESPCVTVLSLAGTYGLKHRSLTVDVRTEEIPLKSVAPVLKARLPPALSDGSLRLRLRVWQAPAQAPVVKGDVMGSGVAWTGPSWKATGDLLVAGEMTRPRDPHQPWAFQGTATLRNGTLTGLEPLGPMTGLQGRARLAPDRVEIEELTGAALGSSWRLEGTVRTGSLPAVEALVNSRVALAPIADAVPALRAQSWMLDGTAELQAVCRGPLAPAIRSRGREDGGPEAGRNQPGQPRGPFLDCLAQAQLQRAGVAGPKLAHPLTDLNGRLQYDGLTRRLLITALAGRIARDPFTVEGEVKAAAPHDLALAITGTLPLEAVIPWLPAGSPVSDLSGTARMDVTVEGTAARVQPSGEIEFRRAAAHLTKPAVSLEQVTGTVRLAPDWLELDRITLTVNGQPVALVASASPSLFTTATAHDVAVTAGFPQGQLGLSGRLEPDELIVKEGMITLPRSRVTFAGRLSRRPDRASTIEANGAVELADLPSAPFVTLPALDSWRLQGLVDVAAKLQGDLADWRGARLHARLTADRIRVRDIPIEQLLCVLEQDQRVLRMRIPSATIGGGKGAAELAVEHRADAQNYLLQADLIGLQLGQLSNAIPAWRDRAITGTASSHLVLSGIWQQRATWRGDGWLNATGERLGNLPLLEKVFRGLFGVLADRLGLEALRRAQITQASGQWHLAQERLATQDLRLGGVAGTEPVAIYAAGSVGLDKTLDFVIEPELSEGAVLQSPATSTLAGTVLRAAGQLERFRRLIGRHRLTGTLDKPEYRFEFTTQELLRQLSPGAGELLQNLLNAVR